MDTKGKKSLGHVMATRTYVVIITSSDQQTGEDRQTGKPVFRNTEMKVLKVNRCLSAVLRSEL